MMRRLTVIFLLLFIFVSPACWAGAEVVTVEGGYGPFVMQSEAVVQQLKSAAVTETRPRIYLAPVTAARLQGGSDESSLPRQIGFSRNIDELSTGKKTAQQLRWHKLPDNGHYAAMEVVSPQARALRLGMTEVSLPEGAEVRFFGMENGQEANVRLVAAAEIRNVLHKNREADTTDPDGRIFWSPTVTGDTIGIEIYLPENVPPASVQAAFPLLSHLDILPFSSTDGEYTVQDYGDADSCQNDVNCLPDWSSLRDSVLALVFSDLTGSYLCTGSLIGDTDTTTWVPYIITANHCISTQAQASSVVTHWFWQSRSCNSTILSPLYRSISGGAALLHTQGMSSGEATADSMDVSLLKLNNAPPAGAYYAGWTTLDPPGIGSLRMGIHHPMGDWKKISSGISKGSTACTSSGDTFNCIGDSGNFYVVEWGSGGTESGSSGSALYYNTEYLIGMLSGGTGSCGGALSVYSSFREAYVAGDYGRWLNVEAGSTPVVVPANYLLLR